MNNNNNNMSPKRFSQRIWNLKFSQKWRQKRTSSRISSNSSNDKSLIFPIKTTTTTTKKKKNIKKEKIILDNNRLWLYTTTTTTTTTTNHKEKKYRLWSTADRFKTFIDNSSNIGHCPAQSLAAAGFYFDSTTLNPTCFHCKFSFNLDDNKRFTKKLNQRDDDDNNNFAATHHAEKSKQCLFIQRYQNVCLQTFQPELCKTILIFEKYRKETFIDWPYHHLADPAVLAKLGFWYKRNNNSIECVGCRFRIKGDDLLKNEIDSAHRLFKMGCDFVQMESLKKFVNFVNIPACVTNILDDLAVEGSGFIIPDDKIYNTGFRHPYKNVNFILCLNDIEFEKKPDSKMPGIYPHIPCEERRMNTWQKRFDSFADMQTLLEEDICVSKEKLASAGFFALEGGGGAIQCYYCGLCLFNLRFGDDVDVLHAQWRPKCNFLMMKRGHSFIERARPTRIYDHLNKRPKLVNVEKPVKRNEISDEDLDFILSKLSRLDRIFSPLTRAETRAIMRSRLNATGVPYITQKEIDYDIKAVNPDNVVFEKFFEKDDDDGKTKRQSSSSSRTRDEREIQKSNLKNLFTCKVCLINPIRIICLPCKHYVMCETCLFYLPDHKCPICRSSIHYLGIDERREYRHDENDNNDDYTIDIKTDIFNDESSSSRDNNNRSNFDLKKFLCVICGVRYKTCYGIPCGHISMCNECKDNGIYEKCPICNMNLKNIIKLFILE